MARFSTGKATASASLDDPYKARLNAGSPSRARRLMEWLRAVWFTRAEPESIEAGDGARQRKRSRPRILLLTRWEHEDVVAALLLDEAGEAPKPRHSIVDLPAIAPQRGPRQLTPELPRRTCSVSPPDWRQPGGTPLP